LTALLIAFSLATLALLAASVILAATRWAVAGHAALLLLALSTLAVGLASGLARGDVAIPALGYGRFFLLLGATGGALYAGTNMARVSDRRLSPVAWVLAAMVALVLLMLLFVPYVPDDAYISFAYARRLVHGDGFTLRPQGGPAEGYSNFLWVALLAVTEWIGIPAVRAAPWIGALLGLAGVPAVFALCRQMSTHLGLSGAACRRNGLIAAAALSLSPAWAAYSVSGLETSLYGLLLVVSVLALLHARKHKYVGVVAGLVFLLLALTRAEGPLAMVGALLALGVARLSHAEDPGDGDSSAATYAVGVFAVAYLGYTVWRVAYYGDVLPLPAYSKSALSYTPAAIVMDNFAHCWPYLGCLLPLALFTAVVFGRRLLEMPLAVPASVLGVHCLLYAAMRDWMPGARYFAALLPLFFALTACSADTILSALRGRDQRGRGSSVTPLRNVTAVALFVGWMLALLPGLREDTANLQAATSQSLVELGQWIGKYVPSDAVLACSDIGAVAYYGDAPLLDINPRSLADRHIAVEGFSCAYVLGLRPSLVILVSFSATRPAFYQEHMAFLREKGFIDDYELLGKVKWGVGRFDSNRCYWVYVRRGFKPMLSTDALSAFPEGHW